MQKVKRKNIQHGFFAENVVEEEFYLNELLNCIQDGIGILDTNLNIIKVNYTIQRWTQNKIDIKGRKCYEVYYQKKSPCINCPGLRTIKNFSREYEIIPIINDDKLAGWSEVYTFPLFDSTTRNIKGFIEYIRNVTELKKLEVALKESQARFKSLVLTSSGLIADGIVHDLNNYLTAIHGNISFVKKYVNNDLKIYERLKDAEEASMKAKETIRQLQNFPRENGVKKIISIKNVLNEIVKLNNYNTKIKYDFVIPENIWPIEGDEAQLNRAFYNIILNAIQAMPKGGIIHITCKNVVIDNKEPLTLKRGNYLKIIIKDNGVGINKKDFNKIFDPYFTTKENGSGLGLTITYCIIENHNGYINIESDSGKGTNINIYLPALI